MGVQKEKDELHLSRTRKGGVSISPYKNGLRLRWRYKGTRPEIYLPPHIKDLLNHASLIKTIIEQDLMANCYDETLRRYRELLEVQLSMLQEQAGPKRVATIISSGYSNSQYPDGSPHGLRSHGHLDVLKEFERYLAAKSLSLDPDKLSSYYTQTIAMLRKWGTFDIEDTPIKLGSETFGPKTFNDRRNCLVKFFAWLVKKGKIKDNPLTEVSTKRRQRNCEKRKPFTEKEAVAILDALRTDRFKKQSSRYSHSQYYPLVAFMLQTGVRNGEAIGLKVKDVILPDGSNMASGSVRIARSLARTRKGTHAAARKEKGTKMDNVRSLPFNKGLLNLLWPLCQGRDPEEYVFLNENGNPIDDKQFLKRIFKPIQEELGIEKRDLYACRHTFATRAVQQGMKAHQVAYLMGDLVETILENYFHNDQRPDFLPSMFTEDVFTSPSPEDEWFNKAA